MILGPRIRSEFFTKGRLRTLKHALIYGGAIAIVATGMTTARKAFADSQPSPQAIVSAQQTSDLMLATLFAALLQEFAETTPANAEQGKASISLIFNDNNKDMRLVGELSPLKANDRPQDSFERTALAAAMNGQNFTRVERVDDKWYYRRSTALSNFSPACPVCHTNFGPVNPSKQVGALMLRVPIAGDRD